MYISFCECVQWSLEKENRRNKKVEQKKRKETKRREENSLEVFSLLSRSTSIEKEKKEAKW
jgi:hypothetical protein